MVDWVVESPLYKYVVSQVAETAKEKGWQDGLREGRQVGQQEGRQKGRQEGRLEILVHLLKGRFGALEDKQLTRLQSMSVERLDALAERVLGFQDKAEFDNWLVAEKNNQQHPQNGK